MVPPRRIGAILVGTALLVVLNACGSATLEQSASAAIPTTASHSAAALSSTGPAATVTTATPRSSARVPPAASASSSASIGSHSSAVKDSSTQIPVAVYFTSGNSLVKESRQVPAASPARGSIDALLAGPSGSGHYSQVPPGTRLLSINLAAGTATVSFSEQVQNLQGSPAIPLFLAQVVDTLTQFPDVQKVVLEVNGQPLRSLGGEGVSVPEPLDRATVQQMLAGT
jgi:spore germination protein GerM